ncbi:MAG: selenocysteine-specific translation elongation factor [Gemmatimonadota bacterium]
MRRFILGTAGHIDHGKTALVHALTGVDTDRLPEEKARGITIDLGFASLQLGDLSFGVVDVPGHENFIRNMLAGATGMDAVLLVVAADEGVMPQTREHLAILDLLAVRSGVVAITKLDLVSDEWNELVIDEVRATLRGTSLAHAPIVPVSVRSGAGLDELRSAIVQQVVTPMGRDADDLFRLPIDRAFTVRGTGTVVTGTVWSGAVNVDETIELVPAGRSARVRGVQVHGVAVASARAGERAALAITGIDRSSVARGDVAVSVHWPRARMLTVRVRVIEGTDWSLRMRQRVRVHLGTAEVLARAVLLDASELRAGESGWVQLRLEQPLLARTGDRVVLRSYSPVTTIAGGVVAEIAEIKRNRLSSAPAARFASIIDSTATDAVRAVLDERGAAGTTAADLAIHTPHAPAAVVAALAALGDDVVRVGDRSFSRDVVEGMIRIVIDNTERLHAQHPLRPALDRAEVKGSLGHTGSTLADYAIESAVRREELMAKGSSLMRTGFQPTLSGRQIALRAAVLKVLADAGLAAPNLGELGASLGDPDQVRQLVRLLETEGLIRSVAPELYVEAEILEQAADRTRRELGGVGGLSAADFRTTLPVTRKHLIPLLEYFDRTGVTAREGDLRTVITSSDAK